MRIKERSLLLLLLLLLKAFFTQYGITYDCQMKLLLLVICALGIMIKSLSSCGVAWLSQRKSCCGCNSR